MLRCSRWQVLDPQAPSLSWRLETMLRHRDRRVRARCWCSLTSFSLLFCGRVWSAHACAGAVRVAGRARD
eukprot:359155-Chlamydomonas_euryale.AAC.8